ncbi:diguanylate cyclase [Undibacterium jejuense]|uniref:diguanylate cyclase n=1 Tax=Undibacterium jejuense TaxID=1344949 RepID=A0A923KNH5_9BURK|nr:GGDEF domain-containing protein [Undibacterium jejuense]MBC3860576.1 diguanylate cyclase [Undibacterium jejuense]
MSDLLSNSSTDIKEIFDSINLGLIVVNRQQTITLWNGWVEKHSGVPSINALGKDISMAFSEPPSSALISAISNAINYGLPVVLSNALHRSPLPLYERNFEQRDKRIQQSISLTPINIGEERHCLIQVADSSTSIKREKILRTHSELLKKEATTDGLTGIYNRRFFDEHYKMALAQAVRQSSSISIFMVDIDFFKQFNDYYGHIAGDKALIAVATALKKQLQRVSDVVARFGGEEFVLMLPNMQQESAAQFAEKLRLAIWDLHILHEESDIDQQVTVSIGYSTFSGTDTCDPHALLDTADNALYNAKRSGRNRSVFLSYQPLEEQKATIP